MIARDDLALLIHAQAAVRVTVKGKSDIEAVIYDELLQMLDMRAAAVGIDVVAVRLIVDHIGLCAKRPENIFRDIPGSAVGAVQTDTHAAEAVFCHADQIAGIAVAALNIVDRAADVFAGRERHIDFAVQVFLDLQDRLLFHLFTVRI